MSVIGSEQTATTGGERFGLPNGGVAWLPCMLGDDCSFGESVSIGCLAHVGAKVTLGNRVKIQGGAYIADGCILGDDCFIGPNATLLNDRYPPSQNPSLWQPVIIETGAVIGGGATILPGVTVGKDAVVGAGAVANSNIPAGEVWAGVSAKFMMTRDEYEAKRGGRDE